MEKNFRIFLLFSYYSIKTTIQHPVGVLSFLIGKIIRFLFFFMFIYFLVSKTKFIAGYSVNQALIFYLTFNLVDSLAQLFFREVYRFRYLVLNGEFDSILLKPYHPFIRILVGGIDLLDMLLILPFFVLLIYFISITPGVHPLSLLSYFFFIGNALVIATSFHILILSIAILTTEIDHALMIYRDLTKMASLPIDIYKEPFRFVLTFIIPVGIMMAIPVKSLFGLLTPQIAIISLVIALVFLFVSIFSWRFSVKKYQSASS